MKKIQKLLVIGAFGLAGVVSACNSGNEVKIERNMHGDTRYVISNVVYYDDKTDGTLDRVVYFQNGNRHEILPNQQEFNQYKQNFEKIKK